MQSHWEQEEENFKFTMAISSLISYAKTLLVFSLAFISHAQEVHCRGLSDTPIASATKIFDVTKYGAIGDGKTDSAKVDFSLINTFIEKGFSTHTTNYYQ